MDTKFVLLIIIPPALACIFWFWMAWDMAGNHDLPGNEKWYWMLAFLFLNIFAAMYYYITVYKNRHKPHQW